MASPFRTRAEMIAEANAERDRHRANVYRCPTHGLIESPTWHEDEIPEDSGYYCPINLTGKAGAPHDGITDEVCGKDVSGPFTAEVDEPPDA